MIDVKVLRAMYAAGASIESIFAAIEADQAKELSVIDKRRQLTAERVRRHRARNACNALRNDVRVTDEKTQSEQQVNGFHSNALHLRESLREDSKKERKKDSPEIRNAFERFYSAYPKHVGRGAAEKKFPKALREATLDEMLAALERQRPGLPELQYICAPARWLNEKRWLDEAGLFGKRSPWKEEGIL